LILLELHQNFLLLVGSHQWLPQKERNLLKQVMMPISLQQITLLLRKPLVRTNKKEEVLMQLQQNQ
jgi:hypothetical protein